MINTHELLHTYHLLHKWSLSSFKLAKKKKKLTFSTLRTAKDPTCSATFQHQSNPLSPDSCTFDPPKISQLKHVDMFSHVIQERLLSVVLGAYHRFGSMFFASHVLHLSEQDFFQGAFKLSWSQGGFRLGVWARGTGRVSCCKCSCNTLRSISWAPGN